MNPWPKKYAGEVISMIWYDLFIWFVCFLEKPPGIIVLPTMKKRFKLKQLVKISWFTQGNPCKISNWPFPTLSPQKNRMLLPQTKSNIKWETIQISSTLHQFQQALLRRMFLQTRFLLIKGDPWIPYHGWWTWSVIPMIQTCVCLYKSIKLEYMFISAYYSFPSTLRKKQASEKPAIIQKVIPYSIPWLIETHLFKHAVEHGGWVASISLLLRGDMVTLPPPKKKELSTSNHSIPKGKVHPRKLTWIRKMMVWKR